MAKMLNRLDIQPGQNVLEIGTGTGYNAALLAELVGRQGTVTTIDIDPDVSAAAASSLKAAGYEQVEVITSDGALGAPENAPYDRIIVTAGAWQIPPAWPEQLRGEGGIVLPLRINGSGLAPLLRPDGDELSGHGADPCSFIALEGAFGGRYRYELSSDWSPARTALCATPKSVQSTSCSPTVDSPMRLSPTSELTRPTLWPSTTTFSSRVSSPFSGYAKGRQTT